MKLAGIAVAVGMLIGAASAQAAYPGTNGKIVYNRGISPSTLAVMNPDGTGQEMFGGYVDSAPTFSADGSKMAYSFDGDLFIRSTNGTGTPVTIEPPFSADILGDPRLSPDGQTVAYTQQIHIGAGFYTMNIAIRNADGSGAPNTVTASGDATEPAFSPDGTTIYFTKRPFADDGDIYKVPAAGGAATVAYPAAATATFDERDPEISPDGYTLAWEKFVIDDFDIYTADLTNIADPGTPLANGQSTTTDEEQDPAFSPDGTKIAFSRDYFPADDHVVDEIFVANADGTSASSTSLAAELSDSKPGWSAPFPPVPPPASPSPSPAAPSSAAPPGGTTTPAKKCKKGQKLKRGKCVRKKKKK